MKRKVTSILHVIYKWFTLHNTQGRSTCWYHYSSRWKLSVLKDLFSILDSYWDKVSVLVITDANMFRSRAFRPTEKKYISEKMYHVCACHISVCVLVSVLLLVYTHLVWPHYKLCKLVASKPLYIHFMCTYIISKSCILCAFMLTVHLRQSLCVGGIVWSVASMCECVLYIALYVFFVHVIVLFISSLVQLLFLVA